MRRMLYAAALAGLMCVWGCGPSITSGEVCDRQFEPAHDDASITTDMNGNLTTDIDHVPDRWWVTFRRIDEKTGKWVQRTVQVEKIGYDLTKLGDFYDTGEK